MDRRVIAIGLVLVLFGLIAFGLSTSRPLVMAAESATSSLLRGRLDVTVVIVSVAWTLDLVNTNTEQSVSNKDVPVGSQISFTGKMLDTNGQPISDYWVSLNLIPQGKTVESGDQCWIGSAKTDSQGVFGTGYYVEIKAGGWWSNYPGVDGAYIQNKNGAGNLGCAAWATGSPVGKSILGYAAISKTIYSSTVGFKATAGPVGCDITGDIYVNQVKIVQGQSLRAPPKMMWDFVATGSPSAIASVTVSWWESGTHKSLVLTKATSNKWSGTITAIQGSNTITMAIVCAAGGTKQALSTDALIREGSTEVFDTSQDVRRNMMYAGILFLSIGIVTVGYGAYRKP